VFVDVNGIRDCVRSVSHTPRKPGQTPSFTRTRRSRSLLRELVDRECVGEIQCASARAAGVNFQACSIEHSDISSFRINELRLVRNRIAQNLPSRISDSTCPVLPNVCRHACPRREQELCQTFLSRAITYRDLVQLVVPRRGAATASATTFTKRACTGIGISALVPHHHHRHRGLREGCGPPSSAEAATRRAQPFGLAGGLDQKG
jgi:hypothetical protein